MRICFGLLDSLSQRRPSNAGNTYSFVMPAPDFDDEDERQEERGLAAGT